MQATKKVAEGVSRRGSRSRFGNRVEDQDEEQLQAVCDEYLLLIFEHDVVVWDAPGCRIVFERLRALDKHLGKTVVLTVFRSEQSTDSTVCLSGQLAM
jgi:hypothetical protein